MGGDEDRAGSGPNMAALTSFFAAYHMNAEVPEPFLGSFSEVGTSDTPYIGEFTRCEAPTSPADPIVARVCSHTTPGHAMHSSLRLADALDNLVASGPETPALAVTTSPRPSGNPWDMVLPGRETPALVEVSPPKVISPSPALVPPSPSPTTSCTWPWDIVTPSLETQGRGAAPETPSWESIEVLSGEDAETSNWFEPPNDGRSCLHACSAKPQEKSWHRSRTFELTEDGWSCLHAFFAEAQEKRWHHGAADEGAYKPRSVAIDDKVSERLRSGQMTAVDLAAMAIEQAELRSSVFLRELLADAGDGCYQE